MPVAGSSHDLTISLTINPIVTVPPTSPTVFGFMLKRDKKGRRGFSVKDAQTIAPRILTQGEIDQASLPPEIALTWYQDDWVDGIGGESFRYPQDRRKLASALWIDATFPRRLRLARVSSNISLDIAATTGPVSGFALVQPDTTGDGVMWMFEGANVWKLVSGTPDLWTKDATAITGATVNLVVATLPSTAIFRNGITYGTRTYCPTWDNGREWQPWYYIYKSAQETAWTGSTNVQGRFKFFAKTKNDAGNEVLWGGFNIYSSTFTTNAAGYNASVTDILTNADATTAIVVGDIIMIGDEKMLVTVITATTLTVVRAYDGSTAASIAAATTPIYIYGPHLIRSSTSPTNTGSAWSSPAAIGNNDYPITALVADGDSLLVCKTDGVWGYFPDGTTENLTKEFAFQRNINNFLNAYNWNGHILLPLGYGGLLDLFNGTITDISFRNTMPALTQYHGRIVAITGNPTAVHVMVQDTTNNFWHLFEGRFFDGIFHWHHAIRMPTAAYTGTVYPNQCALFIHYVNSGTASRQYNRIWLGFNSATLGATFIPQFTTLGNISDDKSDAFLSLTTAEMVTVKYDANLPRVSKHFASLDIESENLTGSARYFDVYYRLDNSTAWIQLGTLAGVAASGTPGTVGYQSLVAASTQVNTSPYQTVNFPVNITGKVIELRLVVVGDSSGLSTTSPVLKSFRLTSQLRPSTVALLPLRFYLADNQMLLNGTNGGNPKAQLSQLNTWDQQAAEVVVVTPDRTSRNMVFLPGQLVVTEISIDYGRRPEYDVTVLLAAV